MGHMPSHIADILQDLITYPIAFLYRIVQWRASKQRQPLLP